MDFSELVYHATLEKKIEEAFPKEAFEKLHLPKNTYPTIYQGLPRYSLPAYPKNLFVKEEFSNFAVLKKRCVDKAILSLYAKQQVYSHRIILFTYVIPGGLGDYFAQQVVKRSLQEQFPTCSIQSIALMHPSSPHALLKPDDTHHTLLIPSVDEFLPEHFPSSLLKELRQADVILQIPTFYPYTDKLIEYLHKMPGIKPPPLLTTIGEYGFICSPTFYPNTNTRCLGLHFLEHGVLLPSVQSSMTLDELQDPTLLTLLLQSHSLKEYLLSTHFYFAYLCKEQGYRFYLNTILELSSKSPCNIDLCMVDIGPLLPLLEQMQPLLKQKGIKELVVFYKGLCSKITVQPSGKALRVIHTGPLDHKTFQILLHVSKEPVGIRGNLSLSEAIALNKAYIYDPLHHNTTLYHGLLSMAKVCAPTAFQFLEGYYTSQQDLPLEKALAEFSILNTKICEEHSALPHIANLVSKLLLQRTNPALEKKESLLVEAFSTDQISLTTLLLQMKNLLTS